MQAQSHVIKSVFGARKITNSEIVSLQLLNIGCVYECVAAHRAMSRSITGMHNKFSVFRRSCVTPGKVSENRQFALCQNAFFGVPNRLNSDGVSQLHRRYHGTDNNKNKDTICVVVFMFLSSMSKQILPKISLIPHYHSDTLDLNQGCAKVCPAGCAKVCHAGRLPHGHAGSRSRVIY
jgi:hypothetical protein